MFKIFTKQKILFAYLLPALSTNTNEQRLKNLHKKKVNKIFIYFSLRNI